MKNNVELNPIIADFKRIHISSVVDIQGLYFTYPRKNTISTIGGPIQCVVSYRDQYAQYNIMYEVCVLISI